MMRWCETVKKAAAITLTLCATLISSQSSASPFERYGAGARASAMGGALGASGRGFETVYYNPALLSSSLPPVMGVEMQFILPQLHIDRASDSPQNAAGGRDNILPEATAGLTAGAALPFSLFGQRLSFGALFFLPTKNSTRLEAVDPASPHFTLHQSATDKFFAGLAVSWQVLPGLNVGIGAQALAGLSGSAEANLDAARRKVLRRSFETTVRGTLAPLLGASWTSESISLGATYRGALALDYALPIAFILEDGGRLDFDIGGSALYSPEQFNIAVSWASVAWSVSFDVTLERWSESPSPAATVQTSVDDSGLDPESDVVTTLLAMDSIDVGSGYTDIFSPHIGIEHKISQRWTLRSGYNFRPTPIPNQVGYTNTIDNSAHQVSLGASVRLAPVFGLDRHPVTMSGFAQLNLLSERQIDKDPNRDILRIGSYSAGGQLWHFGLAFQRGF